jgi:hypothetical protein
LEKHNLGNVPDFHQNVLRLLAREVKETTGSLKEFDNGVEAYSRLHSRKKSILPAADPLGGPLTTKHWAESIYFIWLDSPNDLELHGGVDDARSACFGVKDLTRVLERAIRMYDLKTRSVFHRFCRQQIGSRFICLGVSPKKLLPLESLGGGICQEDLIEANLGQNGYLVKLLPETLNPNYQHERYPKPISCLAANVGILRMQAPVRQLFPSAVSVEFDLDVSMPESWAFRMALALGCLSKARQNSLAPAEIIQKLLVLLRTSNPQNDHPPSLRRSQRIRKPIVAPVIDEESDSDSDVFSEYEEGWDSVSDSDAEKLRGQLRGKHSEANYGADRRKG